MKRLVLIVAALVMMGATGGSAPTAKDRAMEAYQGEDYIAARDAFIPLAEKGDVDAQYRLGVMYYLGQGIKPEPEKGAKWLTLAAKQGHDDAQYVLGRMYIEGRGVPFNPSKGQWWIRQAAAHGNLDALHWLVNNGECPRC